MGSTGPGQLDAGTRRFYEEAIAALDRSRLPWLIGGAYAFERYTGIARHTKDLDVYARPSDARAILAFLSGEGYRTELTFPHWLGKAYQGDRFIDVIFAQGNGAGEVDDAWFAHSMPEEVVGRPVRLIPVEEMIWSKAFVQERERFDGCDVAHLLLARADVLDWRRLIERFGRHWRVLLAHLALFGFIYPGERSRVPDRVLEELIARLQAETGSPPPDGRLCQGTLLSREQYLADVGERGFADARLPPHGMMKAEDVARWTAAIGKGDIPHFSGRSSPEK